MNLIHATESDRARKTFYPTPDRVADMLLDGVDLKKMKHILEPSAGKGDLARYIVGSRYALMHNYRIRGNLIEKGEFPRNDWEWKEAFRMTSDVDCIEIDPVLRNVLDGAGFRVVHDDFLTYETQKRYDLVVMNPPFDQGCAHLLKAIDLMRRGGTIACILNAETLKNPYSYQRQELVKALSGYGATVRFVEDAFSDAERATDVEIALVTLEIPAVKMDSTIMDEMRKAPTYKSAKVPTEVAQMVQYNAMEEWVNRYNYEVACGIRLIEEYDAMRFVSESENKYEKPLISIRISGKSDDGVDINEYIRATRLKYWQKLFVQPLITEKFTHNLLEELRDSVYKLADYEFSVFNIFTLIIKFNKKAIRGVEDTIIALFDKWTASWWHEDSPNRHYYDGWKTNDCFRVGKKVILSFNGFSSWSGDLEDIRVTEYLMDVEKTLAFLDGGRTEWPLSVQETIKKARAEKRYKNIETRYFFATFYKKGTCHLVFKNMDLLEKFNIFASQKKGWLPPDYGKKRYANMSEEAQRVVDSFQGREKYEEVMARQDYYLDVGTQQQVMLPA